MTVQYVWGTVGKYCNWDKSIPFCIYVYNIIYPFMPFILFYILVSTSCSNYGVALITKCLVNMMNIVTMGSLVT